MNWKGKEAEGLLRRYIEGNGESHYDAPTFWGHENFSTPNPSCADSVYDRLLGCNCRQDYGIADGACGSLFMQWMKLAVGRAVKAYLSSPLLLALLPLIFGAAIGYYVGTQNNGVKKKQATVFGRLSNFFRWDYLHHIIIPSKCISLSSELFDESRDNNARDEINAMKNKRESGVEIECIPRHIAVIMDGNRRYGKEKYGSATRGHWDGSRKLVEFLEWCVAEGIETLTVYAFSTENWNRDAEEISALKSIFLRYFEELRETALKEGLRICVLATDKERIPDDMRRAIERLQDETRHGTNFLLNVCLSYGGRNEISNACKSIVMDVQAGRMEISDIGEASLQKKMLTSHCSDPEIIIRTSGEERISNFLLWQCAYSEFFFLEKRWPELEKSDLLSVIRTFARERQRRFGK